jgi:HNH endonuclease
MPQRQRVRTDKDRERERRRVRPARTCPGCGEQYHPTSGKQKHCSRRCSGVVHRESGELRRKWPASNLTYRNCRECGRVFVSQQGRCWCSGDCTQAGHLKAGRAYNQGRPRKFTGRCRCGAVLPTLRRQRCDSCLAASRQARKRRERQSTTGRQRKQRENKQRKAAKLGVIHEPYTLAEIAERDHYRCGLCHKLVAMAKAIPHAKAPTIDHIVPLSVGGDDTKANVQLAHFLCNSRKHTGGSQQLKLIG